MDDKIEDLKKRLDNLNKICSELYEENDNLKCDNEYFKSIVEIKYSKLSGSIENH